MFDLKKKTKPNFDYSNCDFECRVKKKTMFGTKKKYVYMKKQFIIICNVNFFFILIC